MGSSVGSGNLKSRGPKVNEVEYLHEEGPCEVEETNPQLDVESEASEEEDFGRGEGSLRQPLPSTRRQQ